MARELVQGCLTIFAICVSSQWPFACKPNRGCANAPDYVSGTTTASRCKPQSVELNRENLERQKSPYEGGPGAKWQTQILIPLPKFSRGVSELTINELSFGIIPGSDWLVKSARQPFVFITTKLNQIPKVRKK